MSAVQDDGLAPLRAVLRERAQRTFPLVALTVPADDGAILARLYKLADVVDVTSDDDRLIVTARVPGWLMTELAPYRAQG